MVVKRNCSHCIQLSATSPSVNISIFKIFIKSSSPTENIQYRTLYILDILGGIYKNEFSLRVYSLKLKCILSVKSFCQVLSDVVSSFVSVIDFLMSLGWEGQRLQCCRRSSRSLQLRPALGHSGKTRVNIIYYETKTPGTLRGIDNVRVLNILHKGWWRQTLKHLKQ